jgi:NAD(P)-dependent dehydrogenase (short-subunit alcohol dehydrogenase family)
MASGMTVIVTGGPQGIGATIVQAFLERGYNVVATSRSISKAGYAPSPNLALIEGDISRKETAEEVAKTAIERFGSIDHLVNNAGIYSSKPFTSIPPKNFAPWSLPTSMGSSSSRSWPCGRCWLKTGAAV